MRRPTIIEETTESRAFAAKAQWWRQRVMKLTRAELSAKIGYSIEAILRFEMGATSTGKPHKSRVLLRYRLACAALHLNATEWNW